VLLEEEAPPRASKGPPAAGTLCTFSALLLLFAVLCREDKRRFESLHFASLLDFLSIQFKDDLLGEMGDINCCFGLQNKKDIKAKIYKIYIRFLVFNQRAHCYKCPL
jgi:hypothetical protein